MEIKYQFYTEEKIFIQKFIGTFSIQEYIEHISHVMVKSPIRFNEIKVIIIDYRECEFAAPKRDETMDTLVKIRNGIDTKNKKDASTQHFFLIDKKVPRGFFNMVAGRMNMVNYEIYDETTDLDEHLSTLCTLGASKEILENL